MWCSPRKFHWGFFLLSLLISNSPIMGKSLPNIEMLTVHSKETGVEIEFLMDDSLKRDNVSGWIEQGNWFIVNFYNITPSPPEFFSQYQYYPIQDIRAEGDNFNQQLSFHISKKIGMFDLTLSDDGFTVLLILTYAEFVKSKEMNPSFVFPDPKDAQKIQHPSSWKDARERTSIRILCDTPGLPIYVDNLKVGISPLSHPVDVLPGWHKVGYFPDDFSPDLEKSRTLKEKMMNDILVMGRLDVFVEEGKMEIIALNYQTLEEDVISYNSQFRSSTWLGFSIFFFLIILMSWGLV